MGWRWVGGVRDSSGEEEWTGGYLRCICYHYYYKCTGELNERVLCYKALKNPLCRP